MKKSPTMTLGQRIRQRRRELKMTQAQLADALGRGQPWVQSVETGAISAPRNIMEIARVLEISPAWLAFGIAEIDELDEQAIRLARAWMQIPEPYKSTQFNALMEMAGFREPDKEPPEKPHKRRPR